MKHGLLRRTAGFTLVELMVVVAIIGILAAIAIPALGRYVNSAKTSEVSGNLSAIFRDTVTYYNIERASQGAGGPARGQCTVDSAARKPATPTNVKQRYDFDTAADPQFNAIGFSIADYVYFGYGITSGGGRCGNTARSTQIYTLFANGDLDADGNLSTFELAVGSDPNNELYHSHGFFIANEIE